MECVQLAPALICAGGVESGSKLHALHTLRAAGPLLARPRLLDGPHCIAYGWELDAALGKRRMKAAPRPASLSQVNSPFIARTSFFAMLKPRPVEGSPPVGRAERRA